jgi:hypothetical protein
VIGPVDSGGKNRQEKLFRREPEFSTGFPQRPVDEKSLIL